MRKFLLKLIEHIQKNLASKKDDPKELEKLYEKIEKEFYGHRDQMEHDMKSEYEK